jgi:hypothetical protein
MEQMPPTVAVEQTGKNNLKSIGELVKDAHHEALETDSTGLPVMLFLIIGLVLISAVMMLLLFLTLGSQMVTNTLGNHFMR